MAAHSLLCGVIVSAFVFQYTCAACVSTGSGCITSSAGSCLGRPDGYYQACESCTVYHSCSGGVINANRNCPLTGRLGLRGRLVWRQFAQSGLGTCDFTSDTCTECVSTRSRKRFWLLDSVDDEDTEVARVGKSICASTGSDCITASSGSCAGRPDGDYQACEGCTFYHSCSGEVNWANRPCPDTNQGGLRGKLVWRRTGTNTGYCDYASPTCTECASSGGGSGSGSGSGSSGSGSGGGGGGGGGGGSGSCSSTGSRCITASDSSCQGRADGNYQACEGCTFFHSCVAGKINLSFRDCPLTNEGGLNGKLVWDDVLRRCEYQSSTCQQCNSGGGGSGGGSGSGGSGGGDSNGGGGSGGSGGSSGSCSSTGSGCITASPSSCVGRSDGDYQACEGCTFYHSCSGGVNWANRPCPKTFLGGLRGKLVWRRTGSNAGICDYVSSTCAECVSVPPSECNTGSASGVLCITGASSSCSSLGDGDYQACEGCNIYHSCTNGAIRANRPCATRNDGTRLVWVTEGLGRGHCDYTSSTCAVCS